MKNENEIKVKVIEEKQVKDMMSGFCKTCPKNQSKVKGLASVCGWMAQEMFFLAAEQAFGNDLPKEKIHCPYYVEKQLWEMNHG